MGSAMNVHLGGHQAARGMTEQPHSQYTLFMRTAR